MLGAIIGDAIGSAFERLKIEEFDLITPESHWTENTVLMLATTDYLLYGGDYRTSYQRWYHWYPQVNGDYSRRFSEWANAKAPRPYYSCRNDGALRVIPVAYAFDNLKDVMAEAERSALVSHNHPEGAKGAQAVAAATFLAKAGASKEAISELLSNIFSYDLQTPYQELQLSYQYSELAQDTVPAAIIAFLASKSYEDAIRKAIALGGDANTLAAMTGGIAEAFFHYIPQNLRHWIWALLDESQRDLISEFQAEFSTEIEPVAA
ncbi:MAG: ADP-ribosylglycohydrolase family protein [Cyanobacteria bacterium J06635_15]